jgi:hypothetical protein
VTRSARSGQPAISREHYKTLRHDRQRELQPPLFGDGGDESESAD